MEASPGGGCRGYCGTGRNRTDALPAVAGARPTELLLHDAQPSRTGSPCPREKKESGQVEPILRAMACEEVIPMGDAAHPGAGDGNRTRVACLEGRCSAIELHRQMCPGCPLQ